MVNWSFDGAQRTAHATLQRQIEALDAAVRENPVVCAVLDRAPRLGLASCYLGAGAVTQTVWNLQHGYEPNRAIKDYDLVYSDGRSAEVERPDRPDGPSEAGSWSDSCSCWTQNATNASLPGTVDATRMLRLHKAGVSVSEPLTSR